MYKNYYSPESYAQAERDHYGECVPMLRLYATLADHGERFDEAKAALDMLVATIVTPVNAQKPSLQKDIALVVAWDSVWSAPEAHSFQWLRRYSHGTLINWHPFSSVLDHAIFHWLDEVNHGA